MAEHLGQRPCTNARFLVDLGQRVDPRAPAAGFAEVIFPVFVAAPDDVVMGVQAPERLVLRRGVTGALDLVRWWDQARRGKAPKRRHVKIELLGDDDAVVMTWRFRNARPCSLAYSPLRASEGVVLMETIELAFDTVEVS